MDRKKKTAWTLAALVGAGVLLWGGAILLTDRTPAGDFEEARQAVAAARKAEAATYAPDLYHEATAQWDSAYARWQRENERLPPWRDYDGARSDAVAAATTAGRAATRARAVRDSLASIVEGTGVRVRLGIEEGRGRLARLPDDGQWRTRLTEAERLATEADGANARGDLWAAAERWTLAEHSLQSVEAEAEDMLREYLSEVPTWRRWRDEAVAWSSRHRAVAIVVDKMARRVMVYRSGRLTHTYAAEFGPRWLGPKVHEGDLATPEGRYRISRRRGPGETIYYRALDIDYPNAEDRRRFEEARREGRLPARARIGGLIELHGKGGRGADWTRGCVALRNEDMRALYDMARTGTPVVIVGALEEE